MTLQPTIEEFTTLQRDLQAALSQQDVLVGENRFLRVERDLLKERINKMMRKIFAAKSEARGTEQRDMFFNEAEALAAQATAALEDGVAGDDALDVAGHKRLKRGRKPLDADLPRHVVRHELPESERVCPHEGSVLQEIGVEASEQLDIIPQQVRVIRHEWVKYACPCCDGGLRLAGKPAQIIPKGLFSVMACRCIVRLHCWPVSLVATSRATPWPPASFGWALGCSPSSTCYATTCWSRPSRLAMKPRCRLCWRWGAPHSPRATCGRR